MLKIIRIGVALLLIAVYLLVSSVVIAKRHYGHTLCKKSELYQCYRVKRGDTWKKLFPNKEERDLVKRINRMNVRLRRGRVIAIPNKLVALDYYALAPFQLQIAPPGEKLIIFDPQKLAWAAYNHDGHLVKWGPASGGNTWCADVGRSCRTARGKKFYIYREGSKYCKSGKYPLRKGGGAPMPYCMHFYRGFALHGSPKVPGYNASHGCVRLFVEDAKWLNREFVDARDRNDRVRVVVLPYGKYEFLIRQKNHKMTMH